MVFYNMFVCKLFKKKKFLNENNRVLFNIFCEFEVGSCNNLVRGCDLIF